ncbi:hypothetical protein MHH70_07355 [Metasolibacillus sp. FSL H7-0170]|uniref:hypothetical protein n=1 Tax=Metasolibacillus TaxID=2703677 RepID=UPI00079A9B6B|nr:hypothetical protein [Metasolibacillus fluoroglycofenilyticus]KYG89345.1 hypothetical protein A0U40_11150 [[Bacillus] sp. KCTC 13219]
MKNNKQFKTRHLHNPDVLDTEKESIFDMHEDMKTVDAIPVEELNEQVKDERHKHNTKHTSSSEKRYE